MLLLRAKKASDYVRACLAKKIKGVVTTDQSDLRSYVTGASEDSKQLEDDAEAPAAPAAPAESPAAEDLKNRDPDDGCKSFGDRNHALVCIPGRDFTFAAQLYDRYLKREKEDRARAEREKRKEKEKAAKGGDKRPRDGGATDSGADPKRKKTSEKTASVGIIIVPNAPTALLTLLNAGDLLERDRFATPAEKRKQGARKEPIVKVRRTKPDGEIQQFKLVDDPRRLSDSDWKRVVAVVAQGAAWQFKGWKVSRPVDLFHRYLGVHFKYDDVRERRAGKRRPRIAAPPRPGIGRGSTPRPPGTVDRPRIDARPGTRLGRGSTPRPGTRIGCGSTPRPGTMDRPRIDAAARADAARPRSAARDAARR